MSAVVKMWPRASVSWALVRPPCSRRRGSVQSELGWNLVLRPVAAKSRLGHDDLRPGALFGQELVRRGQRIHRQVSM